MGAYIVVAVGRSGGVRCGRRGHVGVGVFRAWKIDSGRSVPSLAAGPLSPNIRSIERTKSTRHGSVALGVGSPWTWFYSAYLPRIFRGCCSLLSAF